VPKECQCKGYTKQERSCILGRNLASLKGVGFEACSKWCNDRKNCVTFDVKELTGDCFPSDYTDPVTIGGRCKEYSFYKKVVEVKTACSYFKK
jgi:hypothetical protein